MDAREYTRMFEHEQRSWWFRGRRRVVSAAIARLDLPDRPMIADLGCGTGGNLPMLATHGDVVGVEPSSEGARFARTHTGVQVIEGRAEATSLADDRYDLVTMLDVLEHLDDESPALAEVARILKPGGHLLVTVPAFMFLWSGHDEALHHRRRYRRPQLREALTSSGLTVDWLTYYNALLFPGVALVRLLRRPFGGGARSADVDGGVGAIGGVVEALFAAERHTVGRISMPFGVSLIGVARRPPEDP